MKIRHRIVVTTFQTLVEHLRYSNSVLEKYETTDKGDITAICVYSGTRKGFEQAISRANSFASVLLIERI